MSVLFAVVPEPCQATAVKLISVVVEGFAYVSLVVCVQLVELFQQRERLGSDEARHVEGGFFLPGHRLMSPLRDGVCMVPVCVTW